MSPFQKRPHLVSVAPPTILGGKYLAYCADCSWRDETTLGWLEAWEIAGNHVRWTIPHVSRRG